MSPSKTGSKKIKLQFFLTLSGLPERRNATEKGKNKEKQKVERIQRNGRRRRKKREEGEKRREREREREREGNNIYGMTRMPL